MLAAGVVAQIGSASVNVGVAVLAPTLQTTYSLTLGQVGFLLAAVNAGITTVLIPWGIFVDRFGERMGVTVGLSGAAGGVFFAASSGTFWTLWFALLVTGMCTAAVLPATGASLMRWFPPSRRGLAVGIRHAGTPLGGLAVALVLPRIANAAGIHWALVTMAAPCVLAVVLTGAVFGRPMRHGPLNINNRLPTFRDGRIWRLAWGGCALFATQSAILAFAVLYLHRERGLTASAAGAVLGATQIGGAILRIAAGRWSDSRGSRIQPLRQFAVCTFITVAAVSLTTSAPLPLTIGVLIVAGSMSMGSGALLFTATAEAAEPGRTGSALGLQQTVLGLAATGSPIAFAALISATSWRAAFAVAAVVPLTALALFRGSLRDL